MNKPLQNHHTQLKKIISIFNNNGIFNEEYEKVYYKLLPIYKTCYQFQFYINSQFPTLIKCAYSEGNSNNQASRYFDQIDDLVSQGNEVIFIYSGSGWKSQRNLKALSKINRLIGSEHVFSLAEFEQWLKNISSK